MKWPKKVKRITYSMQITSELLEAIIERDYSYPLNEKLERVQGTVCVEYGIDRGSVLYITVNALSDTEAFWDKIFTTIKHHAEG